MENFATYINPEIVAACLVIGFIVKKWVKDVDNKWIPTIVTVFGVLLAVIGNFDSVSVGAVVGGAMSGLASTGMHQMFKQWLDNGGK